MELSITLVAIIIGAFILLKFARKFASKIVGVLLILGLALSFMYYKSLGPFTENVADIQHLEDKYCGKNGDHDICDCILKPAQADMKTRFSKSEIAELGDQKIRAAYVLKKSLSASKEAAIICLTNKLGLEGAENKYKVFLQDFVPIENKYLDFAEEKARELGEKLKNEVKTFQENKKDIDDKY